MGPHNFEYNSSGLKYCNDSSSCSPHWCWTWRRTPLWADHSRAIQLAKLYSRTIHLSRSYSSFLGSNYFCCSLFWKQNNAELLLGVFYFSYAIFDCSISPNQYQFTYSKRKHARKMLWSDAKVWTEFLQTFQLRIKIYLWGNRRCHSFDMPKTRYYTTLGEKPWYPYRVTQGALQLFKW